MTINSKVGKNKEQNELILKRRKKRRIKKYTLSIILLVSIVTTLCLKLPYFAIKDIEVTNNRNITSEEIKKLSQVQLGKNIFHLNLNKIKESILTNSYILDANVKRQFPDHIKIDVQERTAIFYVKQQDKYLIIDKDGVVLEEKATIDGMKLIKLEGFEKDPYKVGEAIKTKDERKLKVINEITDLIARLNDGMPEPAIVNIDDLTNITFCYGDMLVKLGTSDNLEEKYNKALNILTVNGLTNKKGYIDISFNGEPVFAIKD
ncbi:cell division protein FtsQ/DivIB [Clostridium botulinum]|uniref:Cell division protein FtsQ n=1 Tax=Clostridium botulinum TaxID=1491 RepID=A0A9Q1ZBH5_CLOBO|nr:FtsQ-type POTRA domain-containing protein [Clostridium botulinum]AEB75847.1 cell division septal protein divIB/FtsQ [Clostridium botulinum BKT015925]KEI04727.1 cell division protein FtsQ [Clostridium botulinum C/D str. Sp77]KLU75678.1 cell division protein FtsQ [Clostridium botulinum V891]KOA75249.1 cell division protein FtsQ [Clostridium botulinum]KOA79029.1 cell division protein FtsQ [Clostridium botulinum]